MTEDEATGRYLLITTDTARIRRRLEGEERSPRQDFEELALRLEAEPISFSDLPASKCLLVRLANRFAGPHLALAMEGFRRRGGFYFTTAENTGMVLAFLLKFRPRAVHVMIGHRISAGKKRLFFKGLRLFRRIDALITYSKAQTEFAREVLGVGNARLHRIDFQVDQTFFTPGEEAGEGLVSIGQELRDYPTLFEAVDGLDLPVTVIASSPWSRRRDQTKGRALPSNVRQRKGLSSGELRDAYRAAALVVVPLQQVDSPAGITSVLEAQACRRPVLVSASPGILDAVEPGETAFTVPCGDAEAMRNKIRTILRHPETMKKVAENGYKAVLAGRTLDHFLDRIADICTKAEAARSS